jgi:hypothetical protein
MYAAVLSLLPRLHHHTLATAVMDMALHWPINNSVDVKVDDFTLAAITNLWVPIPHLRLALTGEDNVMD